MTEVVSS